MWANNEVGTVQPVAELAAVAREYRIPFHSDAVQAAGQLPVSLAGQRRRRAHGHRAQDRRPGRRRARCCWRGGPTWCRFCTAAGRNATCGPEPWTPRRSGPSRSRSQIATERRADEDKRLAALRDDLIAQVLAAVPDAMLNGAPPGPGRLPGNAHFSFPGCEGDALLMLLDAKGIACSTGSACTAGVAQPSHVLLAMGADEARARGSLRFSLGHSSTQADVDALGAVIGEAVERARRARRPLTPWPAEPRGCRVSPRGGGRG